MTETVTEKKFTVKTMADDMKVAAQTAYMKGSAVAGELGTMTKGNVDAVVASSRILGAGLKELGEGSMAEGKQAVDTFVADIKAFAAVKSPMELFQLQMNLAKRNFDSAMALGTKNGKAIAKLASDSAAPLSTQAKANVAKIRQTA